MDITTDTHKIAASYTINNTYNWHDLDVNGYTLEDVVTDMLEFWNDHSEAMGKFMIEDRDTVDGSIVVGLSGQVLAYDLDGLPSHSDVDDIYILITAEPRNVT